MGEGRPRPSYRLFPNVLRHFVLTAGACLLSFAYPSATIASSNLPPCAKELCMDMSERRQLTRYPMRTPIRFKAMGLAADKSEHFTEALNVSQGGFYFATSAPLQIG